MTTPRPEAGADRLPAAEVERMFAAIAPRYDLLNHLLSFGLDRLWRRAAARRVPQGSGLRIVDLCTGTGDLAAALARRTGPRGKVVGLDFCLPMIERARRKFASLGHLAFVAGDATRVPLESGAWDAATMAFGLRNIGDADAALAEMRRLLVAAGRIMVLEFCPKRRGLWAPVFGFYFRRLLPIVGGLVSRHRGAYRYLPRSVTRFDTADELAARVARAGFAEVTVTRLVGGAAVLVQGRKAPPPRAT